VKISREPVLTAVGLLAPAVQLLVAFFVHDPAVQTTTNAVAAAAAGVVSGFLLRSEKLAPMILGLAQAVLALFLSIGWALSAEQQGAIMAFVGVAVAAYVRTQVFASVPAEPFAGPIAARHGGFDEYTSGGYQPRGSMDAEPPAPPSGAAGASSEKGF
jgi:hypothetical protein